MFRIPSNQPRKERSLRRATAPSALRIRKYATPQKMKPKKESNRDDMSDNTRISISNLVFDSALKVNDLHDEKNGITLAIKKAAIHVTTSRNVNLVQLIKE